VFDATPIPGEDERTDRRPEVPPLQQTIRIPDDVTDQLRLLAAVTGMDEQEHLRRAVRGYLETSGRTAEVTAFADRARERLRPVLDRLGDL
jgi:predicted transcriptional regulator